MVGEAGCSIRAKPAQAAYGSGATSGMLDEPGRAASLDDVNGGPSVPDPRRGHHDDPARTRRDDDGTY